MKRSYADYIKTGEMDQLTATRHQSIRDAAKAGMLKVLAETARQGNPADAAAFGGLDVIAVRYGPADAATVLRHYADVCERQAKGGGA
ncbi:hypothetical protein ACVI3U_002829 [Sinorhizobium medicae]